VKRASRPWPVLIRRLVDTFVLTVRNHEVERGGVRVYETEVRGEREFLIVMRIPARETARPGGGRPPP
jgi:hypothetical protein